MSKARVSSFALALVASLALAGLAAGSASALSVSPEKAAFLIERNGVVTVQDHTGRIETCNGVTGSGAFTNGSEGQLSLKFSACEIPSVATCTSAGQAKGTVVTPTLDFKLVYLNAGKTVYGVMLSPHSSPLSGTFAEFTCAGIIGIKWTGSLLGAITEPPLNQETTRATIEFSGTNVQQYQQIEGTGTKYHLSQSTNGGAASEAGLATWVYMRNGNGLTFIP